MKTNRQKRKQLIIEPRDQFIRKGGIQTGVLRTLLLLSALGAAALHVSGGIFVGAEITSLGSQGKDALRCRYLTLTGIDVKSYWHGTEGLFGRAQCGWIMAANETKQRRKTAHRENQETDTAEREDPHDQDPVATTSVVDAVADAIEVKPTQDVPVPFVLSIDGYSSSYQAQCKAIPISGDARDRWGENWRGFCREFPGSCPSFSGNEPNSFVIHADAVSCRIRKDGEPGPLTAKLTRGSRIIETVSDDSADGWIEMRSDGPWNQDTASR